MKSIEKIRDEYAGEARRLAQMMGPGPINETFGKIAFINYQDGFDAAVKLMSSREKILVEALNVIVFDQVPKHVQFTGEYYENVAEQALNQYEKLKGGEK